MASTIKTNSKLHTAILATFYAMVSGAFYRVAWQRKVKTLKAYASANLCKHVTAYVKAGLNYDNLATVREKRTNGELPSVNAGLSWGVWHDYPRVIEHNGAYYLRLYPANEFGRMAVSYSLDGQAVTLEQAKAIALASEFSERENLDCFVVKLDNLKEFERVVTPSAPNWENSPEAFLVRD